MTKRRDFLALLAGSMQTPFIGPSYNLESRPASVQRTINMVPVPLEPGNERAPWVFKDVPGLVQVYPTLLLDQRLLVQQSRLAITPPANAKSYNAWPVATRLANGDILVGYTSTVGHNTSNDANGVIKRSTDNGATWGAEIIVYNDGSKGVNLYGLGQSDTGRLFATLWMQNVSVADTGEALIAYSDDNGATWSAPVNVTSAGGLTKTTYSSGPVVIAPNGDLLATIEGVDIGQSYPTDDQVRVLKSTNNGVSWSLLATVASPSLYPGRFYGEPFMLRVGVRIYCYMRTGNLSGSIYRSYSDDSGVSWTAPVVMFEGVSVPNIVRMESGLLVAVMRQEATGEGRGVLYCSGDNGVTWARSFLDDPGYEMVYGAPVDLLDGTVLCVYTNEVTSGATASVVAAVAVPVLSSYAPWGAQGSNVSILDSITARCVTGGGAARGAVAFSGATHLQCEITVVEGDLSHLVGVMQSSASLSTYPGAGAGGVAFYLNDGDKYIAGVNSAFSTAGAVGDCYGIDWVGDGSLKIHRNGTLLGTITTGLTGDWYPAWGPGSVTAVKRGANLNTTGPFRYPISGASPLE